MPRINIYIRNEDLERWKEIEDKPTWIHDILQNLPHMTGHDRVIDIVPRTAKEVKAQVEKLPKRETELDRLRRVEKGTLRQRL